MGGGGSVKLKSIGQHLEVGTFYAYDDCRVILWIDRPVIEIIVGTRGSLVAYMISCSKLVWPLTIHGINCTWNDVASAHN